MKKYIEVKTTKKSNEINVSEKSGFFINMLCEVLKIIAPKANKDESKFDEVDMWCLEYDFDYNCVIREMGLNNKGDVIVKMPSKRNYGYFSDISAKYDDFKKFSYFNEISEQEFEEKCETTSFWESIKPKDCV